MRRVLSWVVVGCVISLVGTPVVVAQTQAVCEGLGHRVELLTTRVAELERQLGATPKPVPAKAAVASPEKRPSPDPLYATVDRLLAQGKIDEAKAALEARKATGERAASLNSLTRELGVVGKAVPQPWAIEKWFQGEGKVRLDGPRTTLLIFWETWCPHCKKEVPKMQKIYDDLRDEGLQVVGLTRLTRTSTEEAVRSFIAETGVSYPIAKESGAVAEHFNVKGIPAAAVVRNGTIIWRGHPLRLTSAMLRSWL